MNNSFTGKQGLMQEEVAQKSIDFLIKESQNNKRISVVLFGGEPTMNMSVFKKTVAYGKRKAREHEKEIYFTTSTNGTTMTPKLIEYLNKNKVSVQFSIDGDKDTQNFNRPLVGDKASYRKVVNNFKNYKQESKRKITARTTITAETVDRLYDNVMHLLQMGFHRVHTETAEGVNGKEFLKDSGKHNILFDQLDLISEEMKEKILNSEYLGFDNYIKFLSAINVNSKKNYPCGAGRGYVAIDVDGSVYPCHRFVGISKYYMGNILKEGFDNYWEQRIHDETHVTSMENCSTCWARNFCGNDCIAISAEYSNNLITPNEDRCNLLKKTVENSLYLYSHIKKSNKEKIEKIYELQSRKKNSPHGITNLNKNK
jgi:uncharacterized protein